QYGSYMKRRYMDAMALIQKYGKPDVFLTMTSNPKWDEITRGLEPSQTPQDRPDLVVRVFRAKLEDLKKQLFEKHILGKVIAHVYVVEFQKRGLSHAHFLLIMSGRYKLTSDRIVSAEFPDKKKYAELYNMVVKHMMCGPCGRLNGRCQCMRDGKCRNNYPREFNPTTFAQGGVFFVDGPGGTGKTFLYRALLATVRGKGDIAVATATSGVAASIMPRGRTAHSRFKIPLNIEEGSYCSFTKQSGTTKLLQMASLIIWDEASMTKRQAVEALDMSMRDIMGCPHSPFGGKTIVFGGDFSQVHPVIRKGTRSQITDATLRRSSLWDCMVQLKLVRNMRAQSDAWFVDYLLRFGNGTEEVNKEGLIGLPLDICVSCKGNETDLERLIDTVFLNLNDNLTDPNYITCRAVLSTQNEFVDRINMKMIERFRGDVMTYHNFDRAEDDPHNNYPPEFLNSLTPNGLPPHVLKLR
uniref:ATP-dependent DNA helicase n=1 Tax=Oryza glaberrima TaxID=4538 RepID=I1PRC3_ORYGL